MFFYAALLIPVNRRVLPDVIKLGGYRLWVIWASVVFFGAASLALLWPTVIPAIF